METGRGGEQMLGESRMMLGESRTMLGESRTMLGESIEAREVQ